MLDSLRSWKDSIGVQFANATNRVNSVFSEGVSQVNKEIEKSNYIVSKRIPVKSHSKEINDLIVR